MVQDMADLTAQSGTPDVIVVMGEGRIVELGRTSSSWRRRGLYPEMVERQRQSFGEAVDVA